MFTQFDAALHSGVYQCPVQGLLGDLVSRTVDVLPAGVVVGVMQEGEDLHLAFCMCLTRTELNSETPCTKMR